MIIYLITKAEFTIYNKPLCNPPFDFATKQASNYLGAIKILSAYRRNLHKLKFVSDWLIENRNENGKWDIGNKANDKVHFLLSDSWRRKKLREMDCTYRVGNLLNILNPA